MKNIKKLNDLIDNHQIHDIVCYVKSLSDSDEAINMLLFELESTQNTTRRNTVALALSELKCNNAVPVLISLIKKYSDTNNYSSLVFALEELNCIEYITEILYLIYDGNFMSRRYMSDILVKNWGKIKENDKTIIIDKIISYREDLNDRYNVICNFIDEIEKPQIILYHPAKDEQDDL